MTSFKWYLTYLKKYYPKIILGLILVTIVSFLALVNPYIIGTIVDTVIKNGHTEKLAILLAAMIGLAILRALLRWSFLYLFETSSQGLIFQMRNDVYHNLLEQDFSFYNRNRTGDLMSRQTGDMDAIRNFTAATIYTAYENLLLLLFAVLMVFTINTKLALGMIIILPFTAFTAYMQSKTVRPSFLKLREQFSSLNTYAQEAISGHRVIKAFTREPYEISRFEKENTAYKEAELHASKIWKNFVPIFEFLSYVLHIILFLYGSYLAVHNEISIGHLITINGYLYMLTNPLKMFGFIINDILRFSASTQKIYQTISQSPSIQKPLAIPEKVQLNGEVEFKNVSYLIKGEDIIKNVSFHVKPGTKVGIIGSTGAGKSTLMNLLCRFYDVTDGEILIDGKNIKDINLYSLRDNIGLAMQDVFLFSDTIEGNIAYSRPECTFEEVKEAAINSDANHFIKEMPDGYDTIIGERGTGLSGGQKQRISLARALLKKPSILILDDTTSAVDSETESYIRERLKELKQSQTTFIIAYRISSIIDADLILVMDNGKIIESGTHADLLQKKGYYADIFHHQYPQDKNTNEMSNGKGGILYGTK